MNFRSLLTVSFLLAVCSSCLAEPVRIDLGMDTGRNDTATPNWHEWQVPNGPEAQHTFAGVTITLRAVGGGELRGDWFKAGLATGATLATDGILAPAIEIEIAGLTPGKHSLVTYHNGFGESPPPPLTVTIPKSGEQISVQSSARALEDEAAENAYLEFNARADSPVLVRITSDQNTVVLNGLEIDGTNPKTKALRPFPEDGDAHADGDNGSINLSWQPAPSATTHHVYVATGSSSADAKNNLDSARAVAAPLAAGQSNHSLTVDPHASLLHYAWRVDSEDAGGNITRGDVWTFRTRHLAFPGAEGYGRFAIGGRGGRVIKVTNLHDAGPGSLRAAVEATGPRTVVFDVSGRIVLESRLIIRDPFLTIAGHTAPGKGICISNYNMGLLGNHDCIIRFVRVRPGDTAGLTLDGMGLASCDHSIIDHCSVSWTQDEAFSSRGAQNITLQRTLISEALNVAGHAKYEAGKEHGYAASISGDIGSFHHNLLAHCAGRNWSLAGGLDKAGVHAGRLDIRNNVVYNWSHRTTDGGAKEVVFVNNYYKPGEATRKFHVLMVEREAVDRFGPQMYYADGNVLEGHFTADDKLGGVFERGGEPAENWLVDEPFFESHVRTTSANAAFKDVLSDVGCNVPMLDEHDDRVINETLHGKTRYEGSITGYAGLPDSQDDVGGWEDYGNEQRGDDWDPDHDGLPTWWEKLHGLNPHSPANDYSDANADADGDGYTNLEDYLAWLAVPHFEARMGTPREVDLAAYARGYDTDSRKFKVSDATGGDVQLTAGTANATFTPHSPGLASFRFSVTDAEGDCREGQINVRVLK